MKNSIAVKADFPFEITCDGCYVFIQNGLAGQTKIHIDLIAVDTCDDELSVLCDGSDEIDYVNILDLGKLRTGFNPKVISLYPNDFGAGTKEVLLDIISGKVGRNVELSCCLEQSNELSVSSEDIFCAFKDFQLTNFFIKRLDPDNFKLFASVSDKTGLIHSLDVIFSDYSGPEPIPTELSIVGYADGQGIISFNVDNLTFDDPAAAPGEVYVVVLDFKDLNGNTIYTIEYSTTVQNL
jgi:hypothetical protein